MSGEL
jgi:hypothetical protein